MPAARLSKSAGFAVLVVCASVLIARWAAPDASARPAPSAAERGRYLVQSFGCNDCHTPMKFDPELGMPVPDRDRFLSGHGAKARPDPRSRCAPPRSPGGPTPRASPCGSPERSSPSLRSSMSPWPSARPFVHGEQHAGEGEEAIFRVR